MRDEILNLLHNLNIDIEKMVHDDTLTLDQKQTANHNLMTVLVFDLYKLAKRKG